MKADRRALLRAAWRMAPALFGGPLLRAAAPGPLGIGPLCIGALGASAAREAVAQEAPSVRAGRALSLPRDLGAHPDYRIEWWYITGWLEAAQETEPYGFQLTFFRSRTDVPGDHPSRFAATQLLSAHAALTDPRAQRLRHDQRVARVGFGIAEAAIGDTDLRLRDWRLARTGAIGAHRYTAKIEAPAHGFGLTLELDATQPVLRQGDAGYSRKGPEPSQASYYLSEPQLAARGSVRVDDRVLEVRGRAWLDHEWSESLLHPDAVGWDWIGMNLDDGAALTAFRLRRADGSALWAGGSFRGADGALANFGPNEVRFTAGRRWTSPATRARYPVEWQVDTPTGRFGVRARLDAQELDSRASTGTVYWEGLSDLLDAPGRRVGRGYLEMTGYAARLRL